MSSMRDTFHEQSTHLKLLLNSDPAEAVKQAREINLDIPEPVRFNLTCLRAAVLVDGGAGSTPKSRTVVKGWKTSNPLWRSFAASLGCAAARCIRTHPLLPHRVSGMSCGKSVRA